MIVVIWLPSMLSSSSPVTVTVCGVSQSVGVKTSGRGGEAETVASPVSLLDTVTVTFVAGSASSTTRIPSVVPPSLTTVLPLVSVRVKPAISSSVVTTGVVWSATGS